MGTPAAGRARRVGRPGVPLFRVAGIQVRLDYSWLLIFALVLWSLSAGYFPRAHPDQTSLAYWTAGLLATLLFFLSILVHELSHSLVALRAGIRVPSITLFLFGGASEMEEEPSKPGTEFRIAVVGPLASFALAAGFAALSRLLDPGQPALLRGVVEYLAWINLALGVFNLLPGLPLDGGRILRALVWWRTGSLERASRVAAQTGRGLGVGILLLGAVQIFSGALVGGLWLVLIGMFLRSLAGAGYESMVIRHALGSVPVARVMVRDPVSVSPDTGLQELVDDYFLARGFRGFPVLEGSRPVGLISFEDVRQVPAGERAGLRVRDRARPLSEELRIAPEASLAQALAAMRRAGTTRLLVTRGDELLGLVTETGLVRFAALRQLLEDEADGPRPA